MKGLSMLFSHKGNLKYYSLLLQKYEISSSYKRPPYFLDSFHAAILHPDRTTTLCRISWVNAHNKIT